MLPDPATPGGRQAVKRAVSADEVARLEREWAVLVQAGHPGLVSPLGPVEPAADGGAVLRTRALPGPSLALAPPYSAEEIAGLIEVVATTLADLHDAGFVHGGLGMAHVILGAGGTPVLCSLGRGGPGTEAVGDGSRCPGPTDDVADLGALLHHLISWARSGEPPSDPWALLRADLCAARRPKRRATLDPFDVLTALADQATDPEPARRPAARALAAAIAQQVPGRHLPAEECAAVDSTEPAAFGPLAAPAASEESTGMAARRRPWRSAPWPAARRVLRNNASEGLRQRLRSFAPPAPPVNGPAVDTGVARSSAHLARHAARAVALGVAAVALVIAAPSALALVRPPGRPHAGSRAEPSVTSAPLAEDGSGGPEPSLATGPGPSLPPGPAPAPAPPPRSMPAGAPNTSATGAPMPGQSSPRPVCLPVAPPSADVDGDGCAETVSFSAGIVSAGPARFSLGADVVAVTVGDWWCTGHATMAVLGRDGSVLVFSSWPAMGGDLTGTVAGVVPGATTLGVAVGNHGGCDQPRANVPGRPPVVVDPGPGP